MRPVPGPDYPERMDAVGRRASATRAGAAHGKAGGEAEEGHGRRDGERPRASGSGEAVPDVTCGGLRNARNLCVAYRIHTVSMTLSGRRCGRWRGIGGEEGLQGGHVARLGRGDERFQDELPLCAAHRFQRLRPLGPDGRVAVAPRILGRPEAGTRLPACPRGLDDVGLRKAGGPSTRTWSVCCRRTHTS